MKKTRGDYEPRVINRVLFGILGVLCTSSALYVIGPWYLDEWEETVGGKSPLYSIFQADTPIMIYGFALLVSGLLIIYASAGRSAHRYYTQIISWALLGGFLLRLYSLIGVVISLESWRPPSYLSQLATVVMLGAYWVWVRVSIRTIQ